MYKLTKKYKSFVIIFSLTFLLFTSFSSQRASANPVLGLGLVAPEIAIGLAAASLTAYGIWQFVPTEDKEILSSQFSTLANDASNFKVVQVNEVDLICWSVEGFAKFKQLCNDYAGKDSFVISNTSMIASSYTSINHISSYNSTGILLPYIVGSSNAYTLTMSVDGSVVKTGYIAVSNPYTYLSWSQYCDYSNKYEIDFGSYYNDGSDHWGGGVSYKLSSPFSATVDVSGASICPSNMLYKDKVADLQNYPYGSTDTQPISADGFGIPSTSTGDIDSPSWIPTNTPQVFFPDVLPTTGNATDIPSNYVNPSPTVAIPGDTTGTIPGDTTGNPPVDVPGDTTGTISDGLLNIPILGDILSVLQNILDFLLSMLEKLLEGLKDLAISLFVPSDTFFNDQFNKIKLPLIDKLGYQQYIDVFKDFNSDTLQDITITIKGQTVVIVKLSIFEKFRNLCNSAVYGLMFFGLAYYNYSQIYRLIRGNSYGKMAQTIDRMKEGN